MNAFREVVIEGWPRTLVAGRPDQRLMRIGEARALEVRHWVRLEPNNVVEQPEAEILKRRAEPEDVVIGADHPDRAVRLQHALAFGEPRAGELIVGGESVEAVPGVVHAIDARVVGPEKIAAKLEIIRRIGEDQLHGAGWHCAKHLDAIALNNAPLEIGAETTLQRLNATHNSP